MDLRRFPPAFIASPLGLLLAISASPAAAANYTITVDASKQTAGNPRF